MNATSLVSAGDLDIFLAKYNSDGTLAWAKRAGGSGTDDGRLASLPDGTVLMTGRFQVTAVFGQGEANQTTLTSAVSWFSVNWTNASVQ
jgi:hypothetical protein